MNSEVHILVACVHHRDAVKTSYDPRHITITPFVQVDAKIVRTIGCTEAKPGACPAKCETIKKSKPATKHNFRHRLKFPTNHLVEGKPTQLVPI